jgi:hypothetical protein
MIIISPNVKTQKVSYCFKLIFNNVYEQDIKH